MANNKPPAKTRSRIFVGVCLRPYPEHFDNLIEFNSHRKCLFCNCNLDISECLNMELILIITTKFFLKIAVGQIPTKILNRFGLRAIVFFIFLLSSATPTNPPPHPHHIHITRGCHISYVIILFLKSWQGVGTLKQFHKEREWRRKIEHVQADIRVRIQSHTFT